MNIPVTISCICTQKVIHFAFVFHASIFNNFAIQKNACLIYYFTIIFKMNKFAKEKFKTKITNNLDIIRIHLRLKY